MSENGALVYDFEDNLNDIPIADHLEIGINAYCSKAAGVGAKMEIWINDSIAGEFMTTRRKSVFSLYYKGNISTIDSVAIRFVNDNVIKGEDRNLYIGDLVFNGVSVPSHSDIIHIDYNEWDGKRIKSISNDSWAEHGASALMKLGIPKEKIIAVTGTQTDINRTLQSALAFKEWMSQADKSINGINIVTLDYHSRRTWYTYNTLLGDQYDIGVIPESYYEKGNMHVKIAKLSYELIGIVYYRFIALPPIVKNSSKAD